MKQTWQEKDKGYLETKIREYIHLREEHKGKEKTPFRYKIRDSFKEIEKYLLDRMGDNYELDGYVLKKSLNVTPTKTTAYIQLFTKESFEKAQNYRRKLFSPPVKLDENYGLND